MTTEQNVDDQVRRVMADILDIDADSISDSTSMDTTASWTSLNHVNLVVALEQEFQLMFDVNDIESMGSFADIVRTVASKQS